MPRIWPTSLTCLGPPHRNRVVLERLVTGRSQKGCMEELGQGPNSRVDSRPNGCYERYSVPKENADAEWG